MAEALAAASVRTTWPAVMFAASRRARVRGRITNLISSINLRGR